MTLAQIVAAGIFVTTFVVILSERLHRTIAALVGAVVMLIAGMALGFYSQEQALAAIDFNTLILLLGMMILVRMLQHTGFFQYMAIKVAQRTRGNSLALFVALGSLTTWLREKTRPVFVIATADDVSALPSGLMSAGCLDEVFFIDLPSADEREEIFRIHLARRERDPARYDLPGLATEAEGFSGSEIEQVVISALYDAFDRGGELAQEDLLANIHRTVPRSKTGAEALEALREWARLRARPAST